MAIVSLPYTLTAGTPENVNNLNSNLTAIVAGVNAVDTAQISAGAVTYAKLAADITDLIAPVGSLLDYSGASDPVAGKWILADGRALSRSTYVTLFTLLSTTYGVGDGTTTFNIPDFRGRVAVGPDNMGTARGDAARLPDNDARGNVAGTSSVTLTEPQLPSHSHSDGTLATSSNGNHSHTAAQGQALLGQYNAAEAFHFYLDSGITFSGSYTYTNTTGAHTHDVTGSTGSTGGGQAHDNRQPYQVVNKIIRIA